MQIPYTALTRPQQVPSLASVTHAQDYHGPLTTSATYAVAKHVRLFYRLFINIGLLLVIIAFNIIIIIIAHLKSNSCPYEDNIPKAIIIMGILDIIACGILMIIVCILVFVLHLILRNIFHIGNWTCSVLLSTE
jgi:hypothetical protein